MQSKSGTSAVTTKPAKKVKAVKEPLKEVDSSVKMRTSTLGLDGKPIEIKFDKSKKSIIDKLILHVVTDPATKRPVRVVYDEVGADEKRTGRRLSLSKLIYCTKYGKTEVMDPRYSVGHLNGDVLDFCSSNLERRLFGKAV